MIEQYNMLYNKMVESKDPEKMKIFGESSKWIFRETAKAHPEMADKWLSYLETTCWNNYLSETIATEIGKSVVNQDGSKGFHWPYEAFESTVASLGGKVEEKPYYNTYALYVTANVIYSDHAQSIAEDMGYSSPQEVPAEKMALSCYNKALEMLKDVDSKHYIERYFYHYLYFN